MYKIELYAVQSVSVVNVRDVRSRLLIFFLLLSLFVFLFLPTIALEFAWHMIIVNSVHWTLLGMRFFMALIDVIFAEKWQWDKQIAYGGVYALIDDDARTTDWIHRQWKLKMWQWLRCFIFNAKLSFRFIHYYFVHWLFVHKHNVRVWVWVVERDREQEIASKIVCLPSFRMALLNWCAHTFFTHFEEYIHIYSVH